jgi:hypothetical protein
MRPCIRCEKKLTTELFCSECFEQAKAEHEREMARDCAEEHRREMAEMRAESNREYHQDMYN